MTVAFEIEHGIDDVLERFRPGDRAFLCDVAGQKNRRPVCFANSHKLARDVADLRNAAGRGFDLFAENRLDRIDDDKIGPDLFGLGKDRLKICFGQQKKILGSNVQAVRRAF